MRRVYLVFWLHFLVCLTAHIITPLCLIGIVRWVFVQSQLTFWEICVMLGATFYGATYVVNHITNPAGFCYLTVLEAHYREKHNLPACNGAYLPRFYTKCRQIAKGRLFKIPL